MLQVTLKVTTGRMSDLGGGLNRSTQHFIAEGKIDYTTVRLLAQRVQTEISKRKLRRTRLPT